mmetsp:Transcript_12173/g.25649  ORF Transcript_12173/g.25649 Transcript_12173/m.25649 type:complete len:101 (+) Transcript_12173:96-398(+)
MACHGDMKEGEVEETGFDPVLVRSNPPECVYRAVSSSGGGKEPTQIGLLDWCNAMQCNPMQSFLRVFIEYSTPLRYSDLPLLSFFSVSHHTTPYAMPCTD